MLTKNVSVAFYFYLTLLVYISGTTCGPYQSEGNCLKAVYFFVTPAPRLNTALWSGLARKILFFVCVYVSLLGERRVHAM